MKRSLFIAIVVLLMATLFVSCNANKSMEDQLVEVTVGGASRTIEASATLDVDTEQLYWFYTAKKLGGIFKEGEKLTLTPVKTSNDAPAVGLKESSLGQMSTGPWEFSFYGFSSAADVSDLTKAVYQQTSLKVQINAAISLAVTLERGTGALPPARVGFAASGLTWMIDGVGTDLTLNMTINEGDVAFLAGPVVGTYDSQLGKYVFKPGTDTIEVIDGKHEYTVRVYNTYLNPITNTNDTELVGETVLTIVAQSGMLYIIGDVSGTTGITAVTPQPVVVEIGTPTKPLEATTVVAASTAAQTVSTNVSPAGASTGATQVTFPADSFTAGDTDMTLDVVTYSIVNAPAQFTVSADSAVVAGIDLTLTVGDQTVTTFNDKEVTVVTFIAKNLQDVHVYYNSATDTTDYLESYDPSTGRLEFKTTHFSEYYVASKPFATIGGKTYGTLESAFDAVQNGETITLVENVDLKKTVRSTKNDVVLDMNGKTISNTDDIWAGDDWSLISVVGGSLTIKGNGKLLAKENDCYALDICDGGTLIIEDGTFVGNITAVYAYEGNAIINGGTFSILQLASEATDKHRFTLNCLDRNYTSGASTITVTGGSFYDFNPADNQAEGPHTNFVPAGYASVADGDYWKVGAPVATIGSATYLSLADAIAAAPAGEETTITIISDEIVGFSGYYATVASGKNIVIDLNGKTIEAVCTAEGTSAVVRNLGSLTLTDSSADKTGRLANVATPSWVWDGTDNYAGSYASNLIRNEGTLVIESGSYENLTEGSASYAIDNYGTGKITINGGEVTSAKASSIRYFYTSSGSSLTVNGGVVGGANSYMGVQLMGSASSVATIDLNGGVFNGTYAVYAPYGTVTINDGTYNGTVGFGTSSYSPVISIAVKGGVFNGAVASWSASVANFITGGTFATNVSGYCKEGFFTRNVEGSYVVLPISEAVDADYAAKIGETGYFSLSAAINSVEASDEYTTIVLMNDLAEPVLVQNGIRIILDLNGKTLTNNSSNSDTFNVFNSAYAIIRDSSNGEKGSIVSNTGAAVWSGEDANDKSEIVIEPGVTLTGTTCPILVEAGTVKITIKDGAIINGTPDVNADSIIIDERN